MPSPVAKYIYAESDAQPDRDVNPLSQSDEKPLRSMAIRKVFGVRMRTGDGARRKRLDQADGPYLRKVGAFFCSMHEIFCMNCFSMMPRHASVCPACGTEIVALASRAYKEKLLHALHHPLAEVRMRAVIASGLRRDPEAARDLAECALRHPMDVVEALEIVKSLEKLPPGQSRYAALHNLCEHHPAAVIRIAAMAAMAGTPQAKTRE